MNSTRSGAEPRWEAALRLLSLAPAAAPRGRVGRSHLGAGRSYRRGALPGAGCPAGPWSLEGRVKRRLRDSEDLWRSLFFWEIWLKTNSLAQSSWEHHGGHWFETREDKFSSFLRAQDMSHFLQCSVGPLLSGVPWGIRCNLRCCLCMLCSWLTHPSFAKHVPTLIMYHEIG